MLSLVGYWLNRQHTAVSIKVPTATHPEVAKVNLEPVKDVAQVHLEQREQLPQVNLELPQQRINVERHAGQLGQPDARQRRQAQVQVDAEVDVGQQVLEGDLLQVMNIGTSSGAALGMYVKMTCDYHGKERQYCQVHAGSGDWRRR